MKHLFKSFFPLTALAIMACSSQPSIEQAEPSPKGAQEEVRDAQWEKETAGGRYRLRQDKPPVTAPNLDHIQDAVPRYEPYTRGGNKNYTVWGKDYEVWQEVENYRDEGMASWYGAKFHGYHTSNGEVYDMYTMTAAHKHLPLPSFLRVTNKENGKQVVVRVNDRGPFHEGRVVDLSYAAAYKLGMLDTGTTAVKVELIKVAPTKTSQKPQDGHKPSAVSQQTAHSLEKNEAVAPNKHIQLLATRSSDKAKQLAAQLSKKYGFPARVERQSEWYRLQMGPIPNSKTQATLKQLIAEGYAQAYFIN
ncbi:septal ring lytic transglycosylase RlpA family protein [Oceanisphaera sp. DM8]|uniref:Endolytic peptidoglycan transglycosylase RlpA n=2 Tax=Oceanisphaera pacifica TaxID=2818389 RepID=A0ABS3NDX8_9GAMM|nr:septal ring lytic transglycosylase RlpA family protein [Oceanisphaera pacifica]